MKDNVLFDSLGLLDWILDPGIVDQRRVDRVMLSGNRQLAAVIAGLIAIGLTASATTLGIPENVILTAMGLEATLAGGGALVTGNK